MSNKPPFDDFLGLADRDLSRERLIVFAGVSGSGKSTSMSYLAQSHPDFVQRPKHWLDFSPTPHEIAHVADHAVFVEELLHAHQLKVVSQLLHRGNTVIAASHLPIWMLFPFRLRWRTGIFLTDRDPAKIERYLAWLGKSASPVVLQDFCRRYGANYPDVDFILERSPDLNFDAAYHRFHKFCRLTHAPVNELSPERSHKSCLG